MKPTEQDITLVERYFDAELSEAEIKIFQSRVAGDEMFRSLVEREKIKHRTLDVRRPKCIMTYSRRSFFHTL